MRRILVLLLPLCLLAACVPRATLAKPDTKALSFAVLNGDLAVVANAPIEYGAVSVEGSRLTLESPYCDLPDCAPNENQYIRLTFPDEPEANYGERLTIAVTSGSPRQGHALMTLEGEEKTRPAPLTLK